MLKLSLLSNSTFLTGTNAKKSPVVVERLNNAVDRGSGQRSYYREVRDGKGIIVDEGVTYDATHYAKNPRLEMLRYSDGLRVHHD